MSRMSSHLPRHVAVIMDGNGRWAKARLLPRAQGHRKGLESLHEIVEAAAELGVEALTVFAFSSENWRRPEREVRLLMELFASGLEKWTPQLVDAGVRIRIVGDRSRFSESLLRQIEASETATKAGTAMTLSIAANYGGRWDIVEAAKQLLAQGRPLTEEHLTEALSVSDVDLMIRTGGECRLSNFMLWQTSYAEIFFSDKLWPDFDREALKEALTWYTQRERRFGRTSEQLSHTERKTEPKPN